MNTQIKKAKSARHILLIPFLIFSIPALGLLLFFMTYTIQKQLDDDLINYQNQLNLHGTSFEQAIDRYEIFASNYNTLDPNFQIFLYTETQLDTHLITYDIMNTLKALQKQEPLYGAFALYKDEFSYYYPSYQRDYNFQDQQNLKSFLIRASANREFFNTWLPFSFSDRTVLIYITGLEGRILSLMVDPSSSDFLSDSEKTADTPDLFFASDHGELYTSCAFSSEITEQWTAAQTQSVSLESGTYRIIKYPLPDMQMQLCLMTPQKTLWSMLNTLQRCLIFAIIALFLLLPVFLYYFYRIFLTPLTALEETMKQVGEGSLELRANEELPIIELKNFSTVFNQMLSDIQMLKVEAYEKQLQTQQAQLQYLQLQIRPHFFLNCLKGIYGMAEKKQVHAIEETILALSGYFRYIFRNLKKGATLSDELHAVSSYINLQKLNFSRELELDMDISADTIHLEILPWSLLTFIENSIKHAQNLDRLLLRLKTSCVTVEGIRYLNIFISDNGGGFSEEALQHLNQLGDANRLYNDYHVGISNIYYRMNLAYENKAMLLFYNMEEEACTELYIPLELTREGVSEE